MGEAKDKGQSAQRWTLRVTIFAACASLSCSACAKQPSTETQSSREAQSPKDPSEAGDRQKGLETCIDGCIKIQLENPDESPYDCRAQCEDLLNSTRGN